MSAHLSLNHSKERKKKELVVFFLKKMSGNANFLGNSSVTGGTMQSGPANSGKLTKIMTGGDSVNKHFPTSMSDGFYKSGKRPRSNDDVYSSINTAVNSSGPLDSQNIQSNWATRIIRTVAKQEDNVHEQDYSAMPLFVNRLIERTRTNSYIPTKDAINSHFNNKHVYLEELMTLQAFNKMLYKEQEKLHYDIEKGVTTRIKDQAKLALANFEEDTVKNWAFAGVGEKKADQMLGDKSMLVSGRIKGEKNTITVVQGAVVMHNIFGKGYRHNSRAAMYFLLRPLRPDELPESYQFTQQDSYIVRNSYDHKQLTDDAGGKEFNPIQVVPFSVDGQYGPTLADREYYVFGEKRYAKVIKIGNYHHPVRLNDNYDATGEESWNDTVACIRQPKINIHLEIRNPTYAAPVAV